MEFFAFLAYLILAIVYGYKTFEPAYNHKQMSYYEVKADTDNNKNLNENFKLKEQSDMERTINNEEVFEQAQQSPELKAENPSQNH